jgi:spermidine/putrescine-binding protein
MRSRPLTLLCWAALAVCLALSPGCVKQHLEKEASKGLASDPYPKPPKLLAPTLRMLMWPDTIFEENIQGFESRYGVKLEIDLFDNNDDAYRKFVANPQKWDLIMVGQYMADRMRREKLLQPVPRINDYIYRYIDTSLINPLADPQMFYFIPFDYAALGISFNVEHVAGFPRKWDYLAEHTHNAYIYGRIAMVDDMRYAMATAMLYLGLDPNSTAPADIEKARDLLISNVKRFGLKFVSDPNIRAAMVNNDVLLAITWSAEAAGTLKVRPDCRFLIPEGKSIVTVDGFAIPKDSPNPETAALFIEFMLHPYSSLLVANRTLYPSVNMRSMKHAERFLLNGPSCMIPAPEDRVHMKYLQGDDLKRYEMAWAEIKKAEPDVNKMKMIPLR